MRPQPCNDSHRSTGRIGLRRPGKLFPALILLMLALTPPVFGQPQDPVGTVTTRTSPSEAGSIDEGKEAAPAIDPVEAERIACFDRVWNNYQEDVWFYGEKGQRIVPTIEHDWLVIRLAGGDSSQDVSLSSPSFDTFNARYDEYFSHFLHDPARAPYMAAYRLRRDMPAEVFRTLMTLLRQDRQVMYVHPAWKIAGRLYAPLERIEILWKTAADVRQRRTLLKAAGAAANDDVSGSETWKVSISPCRQSVWQSANLLADDILVERAHPLLMVLEPPVGVRFTVGMNGATPGSPIPFALEIRFGDRVKLESSTIANLNLKPSGIFHNLYDIRYDAPLSSVDLNNSPIRITGDIRIYATGEYSLPGIPVYYTDSNAPGSRVQRVKTAEQPVRIAAMIPETGEGYDLQVADFGPLPASESASVPAPTGFHTLLILLGLLLLGLSVSAAAILRKKEHRPGLPTENHALKRCRRAVDAAVAAMRQKNGLAEVAALGSALKMYLAEFAGLDKDRRGGSHASFFRRIEPELPDSYREPVAELLYLIEETLARGDRNAIPDALAEQATRLVEGLQNIADSLPETADTP